MTFVTSSWRHTGVVSDEEEGDLYYGNKGKRQGNALAVGGQKLGDPVLEFSVKDMTGHHFPPCGQVRNIASSLWKEGVKLEAGAEMGEEGRGSGGGNGFSDSQ